MKRMRYGSLDLNLLMVLERLLARQSVSGAATDLGLSQPAASRALARIRETLGDPILVRAGRSMVLTERARGLVAPVSAALEAAQQVFAPPPDFDPQTATGTFTVALGDEAQAAFLGPLFARLQAEAPNIDLRIYPLQAVSLDQARRGELDLAIGPDLSALPSIAGAVDLSEVVARPLYTRRFVVAAAPGAWPEPPDLDAYLAAQHAIVSFEGGGRGFVDELLAARGLRRRVAVSVSSFQAVARLVARTRLLAVMPAEVCHTAGGALVAHPPPIDLPQMPMLVLWHPRRTTEARHRFLRQLASDVVCEQVDAMA